MQGQRNQVTAWSKRGREEEEDEEEEQEGRDDSYVDSDGDCN